jgi:hypothetical protein
MRLAMLSTLGLLSLSFGGGADAQPLPKAEDLGAAISRDVVAVERYRAYGIGVDSGFTLHLRPRQNVYGDCRAQQIRFIRRARPLSPHVTGTLEIERLELKHRYRRPNWVESRAQRDCGDPLQGVWITAENDYAFQHAAGALAQIAKAAAQKGPLPFAYHCEAAFDACRSQQEELAAAMVRPDGELLIKDDGFTLRFAPETTQDLDLKVALDQRGRITSVRIEHRVPTLS